VSIRIVPIDKPNDATRSVSLRLRDEDVHELWALGRVAPKEAVVRSVQMSTEAYVVMADDEPIAVFGVYIPVLGRTGVPWFLGTREVDRHARAYVRMGRRYIAHLLDRCDVLMNMASAESTTSLRFLSAMGFDIHEPVVLPSGARAVTFSMEKNDNV